MKMYKALIIFIALLFTAAGGYYISSAGGGIMTDIILGNVTQEESLTHLDEEDVAGTFVCLNSSTCKRPYTLILKNDKSAQLIAATPKEIEDTKDDENTKNFALAEQGNWDIGVKNMLIITFTKNNDEEYTVPQKVIVKNVTRKILSKISYTKAHYTDIHNPIFVKYSE